MRDQIHLLAAFPIVEPHPTPFDSQDGSSGSVEFQDNPSHFLKFRIQPSSQILGREKALIDK